MEILELDPTQSVAFASGAAASFAAAFHVARSSLAAASSSPAGQGMPTFSAANLPRFAKN